MLDQLLLGLGQAMSWSNLIWCMIGTVLGTAIGVLPGLGPLAAISLLLPVVLQMSDATSALIMLAGIYYGSQYGGSTTSILMNIPGESASVVTTMDGYAMTKQGRAGVALFFAAVGSFVAGCIATLAMAVLSQPMSDLGMRFASQEITALMFLGLVGAIMLSQGDPIKNLAMVVLGLLLSLIGTDINSAVNRFDFGWLYLTNGLEIAVLAMGMLGLAEIVRSMRVSGVLAPVSAHQGYHVTSQDWRQATPAMLRGTVIGSLLGLIPGGGGIISSLASYAMEKKLDKDSRMGRGAIQGVAGPESANNAGAQTSFVPMLTLGVPPNPVIALMLTVMIAHGLQPGPQIMTLHADVFWTLIASMLIGNLMLLILNLPLIGIWIRLLSLPVKYLYPVLIVLMCVGAYSIKNSYWDVFMLIPLAMLGMFLTHHRCNVTTLIMAFVLGHAIEENLRRSLVISQGDWLTFLDRPLSLCILSLAIIMLVWPLVKWLFGKLVLAYQKVDQ